MKTPRRNFVVEFKSARTRSKAPPRSMWGDIDFKTLAQQVEDQAPNLFKTGDAQATNGGDGLISAMLAAADEPTEAAIIVPTAQATGGESKPVSDQQTEGVFVPTKSQPPLQPEMSPPDTYSTVDGAVLAPALLPIEADRDPEHLPVEIDDDDDGLAVLAALEAENRHLKKLLADRLRKENMRLRTLLARVFIQ